MSFAADKHPRGKHGQFAGGGGAPSFSRMPLAEPVVPKRSLARSSSVWRTGAAIHAIPASAVADAAPDAPPIRFGAHYRLHVPGGMKAYEHKQALKAFARAVSAEPANSAKRARPGTAEPSHQTGTFLRHAFRMQPLPGVSDEDHLAHVRAMGSVVTADRKPTIDQANTVGIKVLTHKLSGPRQTTWFPPEGTTRASMNKAFNHAALLALHDHGVGHFDFKMDDHLKAEMTPLVPFIRHARRRQVDNLAVAFKGQRAAYKAAWGKPFKDNRRDARTGEVRRRLYPNDVLVKRSAD